MITRCAPFAVLHAALDIADGSAKGFAGSLPQRDKGRHQGASPHLLQGTWLQASPPRILGHVLQRQGGLHGDLRRTASDGVRDGGRGRDAC